MQSKKTVIAGLPTSWSLYRRRMLRRGIAACRDMRRFECPDCRDGRKHRMGRRPSFGDSHAPVREPDVRRIALRARPRTPGSKSALGRRSLRMLANFGIRTLDVWRIFLLANWCPLRIKFGAGLRPNMR